MKRVAPLVLLLWSLPPSARAGKAELIAAFDDDAGDAYGPGSYVAPGDSEISESDFDLRRFEVWLDGSEVTFKVTMAGLFRVPGATARLGAVPIQFWNSIYLQNVDIYIDTDPSSPAGQTACVPGRRVAFPPGRTWKVAVVLTPQPGPSRGIIQEALGTVADHMVFPDNVQVAGRTMTARVPVFDLGGPPQRRWAYSVHVSGARWERTFSVVDRLSHGKPQADALTMPVLPVKEAWAFGGGFEGQVHPRVVDVLLPRGANQRAYLGAFKVETGEYARVPFVSLEDQPRFAPLLPSASELAAPAKPAGPQLKVVDIAEGTVTISGPVAGIAPMMIGRVLDASGAPVARVMAFRIIEGGLAASVLDGGERIVRGAAVRFELQAVK